MECVFAGYEVQDDGVLFRFNIPDPEPGVADTLTVKATDAQLSAVTTAPQLRTLVTTLLNRKVRRNGFAAKLNPFLGQSVTI